MDVYSIGEMVIDFTPGSEPASYIRNAGGAPANLAIEVARNGLEAAMCCSLGDDDFGRFLRDTLEENNVHCIKPELAAEAITTMAFVSLTEDGDRSFTFARKPGADMLLEEADVREEDIQGTKVVHAGSCSLSAEPASGATRRALKLGRDLNKLVSFDVNYRDLLWDGDQAACMEAVRQILPHVDLLKVSEEEAEALGGEEKLRELQKENGITAVVETLGSKGARCFFGDQIIDVPTQPVKSVDTTAAGDAFWGTFLSTLLLSGITSADQITEEALREALLYANAAGGLCVQTYGAIRALPNREQIKIHEEEIAE